MANNSELDGRLMREMFNTIRSDEIKNINTQKYDDKAMARRIEGYILKKVKEEMKTDEN